MTHIKILNHTFRIYKTIIKDNKSFYEINYNRRKLYVNDDYLLLESGDKIIIDGDEFQICRIRKQSLCTYIFAYNHKHSILLTLDEPIIESLIKKKKRINSIKDILK